MTARRSDLAGACGQRLRLAFLSKYFWISNLIRNDELKKTETHNGCDPSRSGGCPNDFARVNRCLLVSAECSFWSADGHRRRCCAAATVIVSLRASARIARPERPSDRATLAPDGDTQIAGRDARRRTLQTEPIAGSRAGRTDRHFGVPGSLSDGRLGARQMGNTSVGMIRRGKGLHE